MQLHVHVWDTSVSGDPIEEVDLEHTGNYITGDETDHIQFSGVVQGKQIELRLFTKDIEYLIAEYIKASNCGDANCSSCKIGIALEPPLKHIDEAYNAGYKLANDEADESIGHIE